MPPVGAVFVAFLAVAVPAMLLMTVWATVTALRILFPEKALPWDGAPHSARAGGEGVPVRLHDILADQQARRARAAEAGAEGDRPSASAPPRVHPFMADLWLRRN